ncbi:MAG: PD40 domain-containing protein [Elusimicrobia bacterium]|nr:PD40 domain-containing protein [Elusimicrobiota bacterium]
MTRLPILILLGFAPIASAENICREYGMTHGLFSMRPDGTDLRLIRKLKTAVSYDKVRPSPDMKRMVFLECVEDIDDNCLCDESEYKAKQVVIADMDGSNRAVIGKPEGGFNDYPNWSPDGGSAIYMHSSASSASAPDLYRYDARSGALRNLTNTPELMESDNHWNENGTITLVAQDWRRGKPGIGNVFAFPADRPEDWTQLTYFTADLGRHCCAADPKYSPDGSQLVYSRKVADDEEDGKWEIVLRAQDGSEQILNQGQARGYWPMWSRDGRRLLWVSFDGTYSIVVKNLQDGASRSIPLVGGGVRVPLGRNTVIFGRVGWPSWIGGGDQRIFFPGTYLEVKGSASRQQFSPPTSHE